VASATDKRRGRALKEREAIGLLETLLGAAPRREVEVSIGDDAAVVTVSGQRLVWTVDVNVDTVHFRREWLTLADVGWRSLQAAASDLAAMGARPLGALSSLILPRGFARTELAALGRGQARAARELGCPVIGGNISRGAELSVTTCVLGQVARPLLRAGASPGDELWLVGEVGLAAAGLAWLVERGSRSGRGRAAKDVRRCLDAWRRPRALVREGLELAGCAHAAIDVSDGLGGDAAALARASKVRVVIAAESLAAALAPDLVGVAAQLGCDALELAIGGGEDYALVAAGPRRKRPQWARAIGRVERGRGAVLEHANGRATVLRGGFDHLVDGREGSAVRKISKHTY
jgi:thiamine-monophosphate kinase